MTASDIDTSSKSEESVEPNDRVAPSPPPSPPPQEPIRGFHELFQDSIDEEFPPPPEWATPSSRNDDQSSKDDEARHHRHHRFRHRHRSSSSSIRGYFRRSERYRRREKKFRMGYFCFECHNRFSERWPRTFAILFGFIFPLFCLVALAALCGYPLALFESPPELDNNDKLLEQQMRFMIETSLYANVTKSLPRICLQLYLTNETAAEFIDNITQILVSDPTVVTNLEPNATAAPFNENLTLAENLYPEVNEENSFWNASNVTEAGAWWYTNGTDGNRTLNLSPQYAEESLPMNATNDTAGTNGMETTTAFDLSINNFSINRQGNRRERKLADPDTLDDETLVGIDNKEVVLGPLFNFVAFQQQIQKATEFLQNDTETELVDVADLSASMVQCGKQMSPLVDVLLAKMNNTTRDAFEAPLTFGWSKCPLNQRYITTTGASVSMGEFLASIANHLPFDIALAYTAIDSEESAIQSQANHYRAHWEADRQRLYQYYLNQTLVVSSHVNASLLPAQAHSYAAFELSIQEATGREGCIPNVPASCWFWFTVMTTIGYGNTTPKSAPGMIMVVTLGFLAIIVFGAVSARAGYIVTSLLEDFAIRNKLFFVNNPWVACTIWFCLYHLGLIGIACYYNFWQKQRTGSGVGVGIGYWFAYISSTTVGFGDYYLEAEVLVWTDCVVYPLMFLLSFTLLASFLTKLTGLFGNAFKDGASLVEYFQTMDNIHSAEDLKRRIAQAKDEAKGEFKAARDAVVFVDALAENQALGQFGKQDEIDVNEVTELKERTVEQLGRFEPQLNDRLQEAETGLVHVEELGQPNKQHTV